MRTVPALLKLKKRELIAGGCIVVKIAKVERQ